MKMWSLLALLAILWNHGNCQVLSQNVAPPLSGSENADIVFALHLSDRANAREVRTVLNYLNSLISGSDVENGRVKIGLLTYNEDAEVIFNINQYNSIPLIRNEVHRTESRTRSSNVDASAALAVGTQMLSFIYSGRSDAPKALIFVTDSISTENEELIPFERFIVESEQVNVFSVGIGLNGKEELEDLATAPENVLTISRYSELPSTIDDLKRKIFAFRTRDDKAVPEPEKPESTKPEPPIRTLARPRQGEEVESKTQATLRVMPLPSANTPEEPDIGAGPTKVTLGGTTTRLPPATTKTTTKARTTRLTTTTTPLTTPTTTTKLTPTAAPACGLAKVDLVIVLDASTSVTEPNYKKMLSFCKDFLKDADIDSGSVRVGIVIYSTEVQIQFHLNEYSTKAAVFQAIDKIPYIYGSTNTADGLKTMRTQMYTQANGDRPDVSNVALVMTDGISNINARRTIPEAELARTAGIHIYAIGIGLSDTKELDAIATPPAGENSFAVQDFNELAGLAVRIFSSICPACGLAKVDLVFILDASTSVTEANYKKMLTFCKDFLGNADIDSGSVRVGVVIYSTNVDIQFHLNRYSKKTDVFAAIDKIPYIYGSTNTADGLKTMRTEMFTVVNGDRPDADNVAIVITDGISNINARQTVPEAVQARAMGIHIYAIGIGLSDSKELDAIASEPAKENSFSIQEFDELVGLENKIFSSICLETFPPQTMPPGETSAVDNTIPQVRLVGGTDPWEGIVEIMHNGVWGTVCGDSFTIMAAKVVCRMLHLPTDMTALADAGQFSTVSISSLRIWLDDVKCVGTESSIGDCSHRTWGDNNCGHDEGVAIRCGVDNTIPQVRLVGGTDPWEGIVEIMHNGVWGTVCGDSLTIMAAKVVCRMLHLPTDMTELADAGQFSTVSTSSLRIWLDDVKCVGTESSIGDCSHRTWGNNNCGHDEDVAIRCGGRR